MKKETYCLSYRKCTKNINPRIVRNKHNRSMIQSNCAICNSKKSRSIMCGYFCIEFINYMSDGKSLLKNTKRVDY